MQQWLDQLVTSPAGALALLFVAAVLEVAGDSYFHSALHGVSGVARVLGIVGGAALLVLYGILLNTPSWNFGKLIGVYVAVFFLAGQLAARIRFNEPLTPPVLVGGAFVVAGGLIMALWRV